MSTEKSTMHRMELAQEKGDRAAGSGGGAGVEKVEELSY